MTRNLLRLSFVFYLAASSWAQGVRKPVFAGGFYDAGREALSARLDVYLKNVRNLPPLSKDADALICPHAGYVYSGQTAAHAYRLVQGKPYETVIVIGTSHQYGFEGCSIYTKGGFETPLGLAEVDEDLAGRIVKASGFSYVAEAHAQEHSVEVQVPFIQRTLPQAKIVPIVMGYPTRRTIYSLAKALAEVAPSKKILIVVSTDLSHYLPKDKANDTDAKTVSLIQGLNTDALLSKLASQENIMCGGGPVTAVLLSLKTRGTPKVDVLRYSDSSEVNDDVSAVVGYLAAAVTVEPRARDFSLSAAEKTELLELARQAINQYVEEKKVLEYKTENPDFLSEKGAFVTIKKRGQLRGCIGFIEPVFSLAETVIRTAILAATEDPRFPPVTPEELKGLELEVSVLTPLEKIANPRLVEVGRHGLVISMGGKRGLLLPQVAVENRWSRETFLDQACLKAGLPSDAWRKGAEIFVFEAIVFP